MWDVNGINIDVTKIGPLEPTEILYEYNGEPMTFIAIDTEAEPLLVHSLSATDRISRYLVSAVDSRILNDLKSGRIDLRTGLRQSRTWVADINEHALCVSLWRIEFALIPEALLPKHGVMLKPELDSLFRLRLVGPGVGPGKTTASDVRMAAQAAESGLRGLARVALAEKTQVGKVRRNIQHYSNLPYDYSLAASFEIAFGRPDGSLPEIDDEVFQEIGRLLKLGLSTLRASESDVAPLEGLNADQSLQVFEAIKALTPPTKGGVDRIEVRGGFIHGQLGSQILTRDDRIRSVRRIKAARKPSQKKDPFLITGVIEEADQGEASFTLRQLDSFNEAGKPQGPELEFRFEEHLSDVVIEAFLSQDRMAVVGQFIDGYYQALDVEAAPEVSPSTIEAEDETPEIQAFVNDE